MQSLVVLLLFVGVFLVVHGVYEERLAAARRDVRVEYRFIPRSMYEEQLSGGDIAPDIKAMFTGGSSDPWFNRTVGRDVGDALPRRAPTSREVVGQSI